MFLFVCFSQFGRLVDAAWCIGDLCIGKRAKIPPKVTISDFSWQQIFHAVFEVFCDEIKSAGRKVYQFDSITLLEMIGIAAILYVIYTLIKGRHRRQQSIHK